MFDGSRLAYAAPDAAQRERALDFERSFIVQAPAGSGKTELLIQRYLVLLAKVQQPESVVAITFTRKAAGEMKRRVLDALARSNGPEPDQEHERTTYRLARAVREQSDALGWDLGTNPSRLNIRTIDALCSALAARMPWLSRLGAVPEVVEDARALYVEAARRTIALVEHDTHGPDLAQVLLHLDNDYSALESLLADMLSRRDQWLRHIGAGNVADAREALERVLQRVVREGLERARESVPEGAGGEIAELAAFAASNVCADSRIAACEGIDDLPGSDPDELAKWLGISALLVTTSETLRKPNGINVTVGFPPGARRQKARMVKLLADLENDEAFVANLCSLRKLPPPRYGDSQWEVLQSLVPVLKLAAGNLKLVFSQRQEVDFTEITSRATQALGEPDAPTDLALALDYRIQHLLVDEFQDTSVTQFELLEKLTAGWEQGDGRTLFAVGDPMQSIYRFREAEVGLFLRAAHEGVGEVALERLQLTANFRSNRGIIEWVNAVFPHVFPAWDDVAEGAVRFAPSVAVRGPGYEPAVQVHPLAGAGDREEAQRVVQIVREARARDVEDKIAILVRSRAHVPSILIALRAAGLRYRAVDIDNLGDAPVTQDLLALTRALLNPADRVSWLAVLRAPWCGLTLSDLHVLCGDDRKAVVWDLMRNENRVLALSADAREPLLRSRQVFADTLNDRGRGLRRWVEGCWMALGGPACLTRPGEFEDAQAFLELLEGLDDGGAVDIDTLARSVALLAAAPDPQADETLQVMTIHKAKGLQFDVVIVPGLDRRVRGDTAKLLAWLERPSDGEPELLLAPVKAAGSDGDALSDYVRSVENNKCDYETQRLLYVAATRAKKQLHLVARAVFDEKTQQVKQPDSRSLLSLLWPALREDFERAVPEQRGDAGAGPEAVMPPLRRLYSGWTLPPPPPGIAAEAAEPMPEDHAKLTFEWVGDTLRSIGTVVHRVLEEIARDGVDAWNEERVGLRRGMFESSLRALGVPGAELQSAADKVERAIGQTIRDPRGRWIFANSHAEAKSEYGLNGIVGARVVSTRIDRTFVDGGTRWIIDFKTSAHEGGGVEAFLDNELERYREKMELYAELVSRIDPRPVRMALYFPLLGAWREY